MIMKAKLRVGILLNNYFIHAWEYKIVEEIINSDFAEIKLLIKNESGNTQLLKIKKKLGFRVLRLHES